MDLKEWFENPKTTITYDYNKPELSRGLMGAEQPAPVPPPQKLYDLGSYKTPFSWLFRQVRGIITG
jgi:hypothetical protein